MRIRRIDAGEAAPAYRIATMDERLPYAPYIVRRFAGLLWWPLLDSKGFVSTSQFFKLAADGDHAVVCDEDGLTRGLRKTTTRPSL
jgi:hypothetical protein